MDRIRRQPIFVSQMVTSSCGSGILWYNISNQMINNFLRRRRAEDMKYPTGLSENEWYIMQVLWDHAPASLREICEALEPVKGWSRHAVTSFLKRMLEKGAVSVDESGKVRTYSPVWSREETIREETDSIMERVYHGDLLLMVSNAVQGRKVSEEEIEELKKILDRLGD
ncbi:hypothetical protein B5F29_04380 [Lachnoclostridium sp. An196]|nr:hypothetical protein B5F29_04380 [Lachnoclostridium sp. An196]